MRYTLSAGARREMCLEFSAAGGRGVEVSTGGGGARDREQAISLAVRCRLEGSVGSDFHDPAVPWNPPGRLAKLPDSIRPIWSDFQPA
jgi:predicted metal-dependent phosphoesterase TrpH